MSSGSETKLLPVAVRTVSQVILPLLKSDLYEVIQSTLDGLLCAAPPVWLENRAAITVVMASQGYPGDYAKGVEVAGERWRAEAGDCYSRVRCGSAVIFIFSVLKGVGRQKPFRGSSHKHVAWWMWAFKYPELLCLKTIHFPSWAGKTDGPGHAPGDNGTRRVRRTLV